MTSVIILFLLACVLRFAFASRARVRAARYLLVVESLPIGTTYDSVLIQLKNAGLPVPPIHDCAHDCPLEFRFDNSWQHSLQFGPSAVLTGDMGFSDGRLAQKTTVLGGKTAHYAAVYETDTTPSKVVINKSGIRVNLSHTDFSDFRRRAYAFNLSCLNSFRACGQSDFLPTMSETTETTTK
jgi:hypothetical protein